MSGPKDRKTLPKKAAKERALKLRELLLYHGKKYHEEDAPEISDAAYDALLRELIEVESEYPDLKTPDSPTQRVGGEPLEKFEKVRHVVPQWSFDNVFSEEEFRAFDERVRRMLGSEVPEYLCELKIDGFKIVLTYEDGVLTQAATRGDGTVGENVTENVKRIASVPLRLTERVNAVVEGEVWMPKSVFQTLNDARKKDGEQLFANPRNAAAGAIRQLDPRMVAERRLEAFAYDIGMISKMVPKTQEEELGILKRLGFNVNPDFRLAQSSQDVVAFWKSWELKRESQEYLCDGVVVKVNDVRQQGRLGYTAKAPRFGVAFKFAAEQATTVVEGIALQVGRTGVVTPVAHLKPVLVAGSTVSRATLHNEDQIKRLDVRVGDTVILQKAGDVIPEIVSVMKELRPKGTTPYVFPSYVEACNGPIERIPGEAAYRCVNKNSFAQLWRRISHFAGKHALDIDGLGPQIVEQLMKENLIQSYADLFTLKKGDLVDLEGFGEKSAENLVHAIAARRKVELPRLLVGLSIPHVGEEVALVLARHFKTLPKIRAATEEKIAEIHGIGEKIAESVIGWFGDRNHAHMLDALLEEISILPYKSEGKRTPLTGKTVVVTGTLESLSRDEAKERIRAAGGHPASSVSAKTDYVLVGADPGSKADDARRLNIPILTEKEFKKLLEG